MELDDIRIPANPGRFVLNEKDIRGLVLEGVSDELMECGAHAALNSPDVLKEFMLRMKRKRQNVWNPAKSLSNRTDIAPTCGPFDL
jgi:hypothetical protein